MLQTLTRSKQNESQQICCNVCIKGETKNFYQTIPQDILKGDK